MNMRAAEQIDVDELPDAYGPAPAKELVDSVAIYGVVQPLLVVRDDAGDLTIVDGNRRLMAARRAKMKSVPVLVMKQGETDHEHIARLTLQMNNLRSTNDYAEQSAYDWIACDDEERAEAVAKESGLSRASIAKRARWAVAHTGLMDAFYDQRIAPTVVDAVSKLPADLQVRAFDQFKNEGKLTASLVKEIEEAAKIPAPEATEGEIYASAKAAAERSIDEMLSVVKELHGADMRAWIDQLHHKLNVALEMSLPDEPVKIYETIDDVPF